MIDYSNCYNDIISLESLLEAWREFVNGKRNRKDLQEFERNLMENVISLHQDLKSRKYIHSPYEAFNISDPKPRNIHKAVVRDRLLHHAVYRVLYPYFDKRFIHDSYSCRKAKGTHKALERFRRFAYKASKNHTRTLFVLKCDIKKFFASIDQKILLDILRQHIEDREVIDLLSRIVGSFHSTDEGRGLPLGNLTSQLLVNVYMNEFDQWMKHVAKAKWYIRYADDFVVLSSDKEWLRRLLSHIQEFLSAHLNLSLHPDKVYIKTIASGVDFLGWVHFPHHRVLRNTTKRRMWKKIENAEKKPEVVQSYLGLLAHGNAFKLRRKKVEEMIDEKIA